MQTLMEFKTKQQERTIPWESSWFWVGRIESLQNGLNNGGLMAGLGGSLLWCSWTWKKEEERGEERVRAWKCLLAHKSYQIKRD